MALELNNLILKTDSYKVSQYRQYPPGTEFISSYGESRGGEWTDSVFFGIKYAIEKHLTMPVTMTDVEEAKDILDPHIGEGIFNYKGWVKLIDKYNGRLPIRIQALPEGIVVPNGTPLFQVINEDPEFYWLTSYIEGLLLQSVWYGTTVASLSRSARSIILDALERTGTPAAIDYKLHDFGYRGVSSTESAALGGLAHLINFKGTDTLPALWLGRQLYQDDHILGHSIPASEHSTITAWGRSREAEAYANMITAFPESPMIACVSDSYDIFNACEHLWGDQLKDQLINSGKTLVIRPDSGDPIKVLEEIMMTLLDKFGRRRNNKGFNVLPDNIRVIQGDGVNVKAIEQILERFHNNYWSADNIAFGMGGALLQKDINRDTLKFAMKASQGIINGETVDIYKDPITDSSKTSKRGRFAVVKDGDNYITLPERVVNPQMNLLQTVYHRGISLYDHGNLQGEMFEDIRVRAKGE